MKFIDNNANDVKANFMARCFCGCSIIEFGLWKEAVGENKPFYIAVYGPRRGTVFLIEDAATMQAFYEQMCTLGTENEGALMTDDKYGLVCAKDDEGAVFMLIKLSSCFRKRRPQAEIYLKPEEFEEVKRELAILLGECE